MTLRSRAALVAALATLFYVACNLNPVMFWIQDLKTGLAR